MKKLALAKKATSITLSAALLITAVGPEFFQAAAQMDPIGVSGSFSNPASVGGALQGVFGNPAVQAQFAARYGANAPLTRFSKLDFKSSRNQAFAAPFLKALGRNSESLASETDASKQADIVADAFAQASREVAASADGVLETSKSLPQDEADLKELHGKATEIADLGAYYLDSDRHAQVLAAQTAVKEQVDAAVKTRLSDKIEKPTKAWSRPASGPIAFIKEKLRRRQDLKLLTKSGEGIQPLNDLEFGRVKDEKTLWQKTDTALDGINATLDLVEFDLKYTGKNSAKRWLEISHERVAQFEKGFSATAARVGIQKPSRSRYYQEGWEADRTLRNNPVDSQGRARHEIFVKTQGNEAGLAQIRVRQNELQRRVADIAFSYRNPGTGRNYNFKATADRVEFSDDGQTLIIHEYKTTKQQEARAVRSERLLDISRGFILAGAAAVPVMTLAYMGVAFVAPFFTMNPAAWGYYAEQIFAWGLAGGLVSTVIGTTIAVVQSFRDGWNNRVPSSANKAAEESPRESVIGKANREIQEAKEYRARIIGAAIGSGLKAAGRKLKSVFTRNNLLSIALPLLVAGLLFATPAFAAGVGVTAAHPVLGMAARMLLGTAVGVVAGFYIGFKSRDGKGDLNDVMLGGIFGAAVLGLVGLLGGAVWGMALPAVLGAAAKMIGGAAIGAVTGFFLGYRATDGKGDLNDVMIASVGGAIALAIVGLIGGALLGGSFLVPAAVVGAVIIAVGAIRARKIF